MSEQALKNITRPVRVYRVRLGPLPSPPPQAGEGSAPKLLLAIQEDPSHPRGYRWLAPCYAHMGRLDDARDVIRRRRATTPVVIPDASFLRNAEHRELFLSGLRLAAGEAI
ncbi:MAG TPA: tetratricopeptide repeat protein [Roseiarcus sp.]|nr:tetratricopeptide repeat protein [Roseiarcus sp.]